MKPRSQWRTASPIIALGVAVVALAVAHVVANDEPVVPELLDAGILLVFAVAILAVGYMAVRDEYDRRSVHRIVLFALGSSAVVGSLSGVFVLARTISNEPLPGGAFVLAIGFSLGGAAGTLIGYYLSRYETSLRHEAELRRRLTVLQRVLRHNIRNEVTIIEGVSRDLTDRVDDPSVAQGLDTITRHIDRVHRVAEKSQDLASVWQSEETITVDVSEALDRAIDALASTQVDVTITQTIPEHLAVDAHPRLWMAFDEALDNAARHNESVSIDVSATVGDDTATVRFVDDGSGIPDAEIAPLVRGHERPLDHTTGIGLWLMYWIVDYSGGTLTFDDAETGGTAVEMTLPLASSD